jgi:hypothetical protein
LLIAMIVAARWVIRRFEASHTLGSTLTMGLIGDLSAVQRQIGCSSFLSHQLRPQAQTSDDFGHLSALAESCSPYTNMRRARCFGGDPSSIDSLAELGASHIETS